ncbi:MAG: hypothetical protein RSF40_01760 [Oscillospiraceae bacterium]
MMKLIKNYYVEADEKQYVLKQLISRKRKETEEVYAAENLIGYYPNIPSLIKACVNHNTRLGISDGEILTLTDAARHIESITNELNSIISCLDYSQLNSESDGGVSITN